VELPEVRGVGMGEGEGVGGEEGFVGRVLRQVLDAKVGWGDFVDVVSVFD